jgi:hypothetical protein
VEGAPIRLQDSTLAVIGLEAPDDFAYYDGYGRGALVFPVIATALAGLCWWLILRRPGAAAPGAPPAGPASPRGSAA